jgi:hypothetical protein
MNIKDDWLSLQVKCSKGCFCTGSSRNSLTAKTKAFTAPRPKRMNYSQFFLHSRLGLAGMNIYLIDYKIINSVA